MMLCLAAVRHVLFFEALTCLEVERAEAEGRGRQFVEGGRGTVSESGSRGMDLQLLQRLWVSGCESAGNGDESKYICVALRNMSG